MSAAAHTAAEGATPLQAAAIWRMRRAAPDWSAADAQAFEAWLAQDELNARAFERTGQVWGLMDDNAATPEVMRVRRDALHRAQRTAKGRLVRWQGRMVRLPRRGAMAAAAALLLVACVGGLVWSQQGAIYETSRNERRVVTLEDGSRLSLDAATRVSVKYSKDARRLRLLEGQARFDVAHNAARPFSVQARDKTVVATGTAFNIDIFGTAARVTLIEGHVIVLPVHAEASAAASKPKPIELSMGQQLISAPDRPPVVVAGIDLKAATAWQQGKLMFDNEPLSQAVVQVNRYSDRKIVIGDAAAGRVPVSGAFDAGNTRAFLEGVTGYLPVTAVDGPDGVTLRSTQAPG